MIGDRLIDRDGRTVGRVSGDDDVARRNVQRILTATGGRRVPAATIVDWFTAQEAGR